MNGPTYLGAVLLAAVAGFNALAQTWHYVVFFGLMSLIVAAEGIADAVKRSRP